jgi:hypothetical protein
MEFNTLTREGGLSGAVRMVIYNGFGGSGSEDAQAGTASKASSLSIGSTTIELPEVKGGAAPDEKDANGKAPSKK